jgi:hypothetical protein
VTASLSLGGCAYNTPPVEDSGTNVSPVNNTLEYADLFLDGFEAPDADAIPIYDIDGLLSITDASASYVLLDDLDFSDYRQSWMPLFLEVGGFSGVFDGQGHVIKGLEVGQDEHGYATLFGQVASDGIIRNLGILDCHLAPSTLSASTSKQLGGICMDNQGIIQNCFFIGSLRCVDKITSGISLGGICASNGGTIKQSYFLGEIVVDLPEKQSFRIEIGGIAGYNFGDIVNCFSAGSISGNAVLEPSFSSVSSFSIGGICGAMRYGTIKECANLATISGNATVGGICGLLGGTDEDRAPSIRYCVSAGNCESSSSAGGICGWTEDWAEVSHCLVAMEHMMAYGPFPRVSAVAEMDDGRWVDGMPFVSIYKNLICEDIVINWSYLGVEKIPRSTAISFSQLSSYDLSFGQFWGVLAEESVISGNMRFPVPYRLCLILRTLVLFDIQPVELPWNLADEPTIQNGGDKWADSGGNDSGSVPDSTSDEGYSGSKLGLDMSNKERPFVDDVEGEVLRIRELWTADRLSIEAGEYAATTLDSGVTAYSDNGELKMIEVVAGTYGIEFLRIYQYENGQLIFAYYESGEQDRLYFLDSWLFRWRYTDSNGEVVNHDNEPENNWFIEWERRARDEAARLKEMF